MISLLTAARQRLDPALATRLLAEHSAQGRHLNREVALLSCEAGPRRLHQRVLRQGRLRDSVRTCNSFTARWLSATASVQFGLLMIFQFLGEALVTLSGFPFPGPLCGMVLLLGYLFSRGGPPEELAKVGTALVDNLG